mgnify:CR=1 FL=1
MSEQTAPENRHVRSEKAQNPGKSRVSEIFRRLVSFVLTLLLMFGLWIIFSGMFEPLLLWLGAISSFIVAAISHELIFPSPSWSYIRYVFRFAFYLPWLVWQVFQANIHLMKLVFHPRMMELIDPHIVTFQTSLRQDLSLVALANSITLTPGTITISAEPGGRFEVHAIDKRTGAGLPGSMGQKIERVFEDAAA